MEMMAKSYLFWPQPENFPTKQFFQSSIISACREYSSQDLLSVRASGVVKFPGQREADKKDWSLDNLEHWVTPESPTWI